MTREKPIYVYGLFTHEHYVKGGGKLNIEVLNAQKWEKKETDLLYVYATYFKSLSGLHLVSLHSCPAHLQHTANDQVLLPVSKS